jgi:hypothetical protein
MFNFMKVDTAQISDIDGCRELVQGLHASARKSLVGNDFRTSTSLVTRVSNRADTHSLLLAHTKALEDTETV